MRIGYFGDGPWAHNAFKKLYDDEAIEIAFVSVRYDKRDPVLLLLAGERGIPIEIHQDVNSDEFLNRMKGYGVDLFISMSFNQIFKQKMINLPKLKTINCHAGSLPFYRGRNVLNWVLINDEETFGITVHYVDEGIDTGDIILQRAFPITDQDDYHTLLDRAYAGCADLLYDAVKQLQKNEVEVVRQDIIDPVGMYCGMRKPGDERIDWNSTSREIFNFVRALCRPGPMASSVINGKKIRINRVSEIKGAKTYINIPGQVIGKTDKGFYVKTRDTFVEVTEYEYDGKIRVGDRMT